MERKNNFGSAFLKKVGGFFTKNVVLKIISVIFAMMLWGYVMMDQNPSRTKVVDGVHINIEGEADLNYRKLVVRGDKNALLDEVSVKVSTELTKYADLGVDDVVATISLKGVNAAGTYSLPINATTSEGTVLSKTPNAIDVEIDLLVSHRIPIELKTTGTIPEGYWNGQPVMAQSYLDIEGPKTDISKIAKAVCTLDISNITSSYNQSLEAVLYDADGNEVEMSVLYGQLPSVPLKMEVLPKKDVRLDIESSLMGKDNLAANYEIKGIKLSRETVTIAGEKNVIDAISSISVDKLDVSGYSQSLLTELDVVAPDGVKLVGGSTVTAYIDIAEKQGELSFTDLPIKVIGLGKRMSADLDILAADLKLLGRISLINKLSPGDVWLYVDVTDRPAGEYKLNVYVSLPNDEMLLELEKTLSLKEVTVTVKNN